MFPFNRNKTKKKEDGDANSTTGSLSGTTGGKSLERQKEIGTLRGKPGSSIVSNEPPPMPANINEEELQQQFEEMMDQMNIPEEARAPMRLKTTEAKWRMVYASKTSTTAEENTPEYFVRELKGKVSLAKLQEKLNSLKVNLLTQPISWVISFKDLNGLDALYGVLYHLNSKETKDKTEQQVELACVNCFKAFMNNRHGLLAVIQGPEGLKALALPLGNSDTKTTAIILELLGAVCLVPPNGHNLVLQAFTKVAREKQRDMRFEPLVRVTREADNIHLQVACIQFMNALVNTPEELDFRIHLRNEIMILGLGEVLPNLRAIGSEQLDIQLNVFDNETQYDYSELLYRFDVLQMEMADPAEIFTLLRNLVADTPSDAHFLSILQHLMLIRDDHLIRPKYYRLIDEVVSLIVLSRNGIDPDFRGSISVETERIIQEFINQDHMQEVEEKAEKLTRELEQLNASKVENETKLNKAIEEAQAKLAEANVALEETKKQAEQARQEAAAALAQGGPRVSQSTTSGATESGPPPPSGGLPPPPPPPPGGPGGPPPPPPPPGMGPPPPPGGGPPPPPGGGPPGPPPPPGAPAAPIVEEASKYKPSVQLKRINWTKFNKSKIENTIWASANDEKWEDIMDFKQIETLFCAKKAKMSDEGEEEIVAAPKEKELSVLDSKKSYNISIMLGRLKMDFDVMKKAIFALDESILNEGVVNQFLKFSPTAEEKTALEPHKKDPSKLSKADQFILEMSSIPRFEERLQCLLFKMKFQDLFSEIKPDIISILSASDQIMNSKKLKSVLEIVLLVGNYMNAGSRNQCSKGFKIDFLAKLANTKTVDNKLNLLHFIAEILEQKRPELLNFAEELNAVDRASRLSIPTIQADYAEIRKGINNMKKELELIKDPKAEDKFKDIMSVFFEKIQPQFQDLTDLFERMQKVYETAVTMFAEDPKTATPEEFFGIFRQFQQGIEDCHKDNVKRRETEEREAKRAAEKAEKDARMKTQEGNKRKTVLDEEGDQKGVMDDLIASLRSGTAFARDRSKQQQPRKAGAGGRRRGDAEQSDAASMLSKIVGDE